MSIPPLSSSLLPSAGGVPTPIRLPVAMRAPEVRKQFKSAQEQIFEQMGVPILKEPPSLKLPASLFFQTVDLGISPGVDASRGVSAVFFDLIMDESHSLSSTVTDRPVENGSFISDHIQKNARSGSFTGLVSNFSVAHPGQLENRAMTAFEMLKRIYDDRKLVTLVLVLDTYSNVAITEITADRSGETGDAQYFRIGFKQVTKINLREVTLKNTRPPRNLKTPIRKQVSPKKNNGTAVATPAGGGGIRPLIYTQR